MILSVLWNNLILWGNVKCFFSSLPFFCFFPPIVCNRSHGVLGMFFKVTKLVSLANITTCHLCVQMWNTYTISLSVTELWSWMMVRNIVLHNIAIYIVQPHPIAKFAIVKRLSVDQLVKLVWLNCGLCPIKSYTKWTLYWFTTRLLQFECLLTVNTSASRSLLAHSDSTNMLMLKLLLSISQSIYL